VLRSTGRSAKEEEEEEEDTIVPRGYKESIYDTLWK
jgi:hypothetical protein